MIQLIQVRNPLQPSVDRETTELVHVATHSLQDYVPDAGALTVSLNGKVIEASLLSLVTPRDGDCIVTVPTLAGGSLLRTLATVTVMAASIAVAAVSAGAGFALMGLSTSVTAAVLGGAVSVAGNLLVGAFLNTPTQKNNSPSYAFDGPSSLAQSGTVIPKGYGTFEWGGNIIASFIDVEGADQYINALACFGFGPGRTIASVEINGKPIAEYGNVQYYTRLGSNTQTPIPNFNRVVNGYPQDTQCLAGVPVIVPGTGTLTQILQVDVVFPSGLWVLTTDNNLIPAIITYLVEYAVAGTGAWQPVVQPAQTTDVVTYAFDGNPNPYPTWCAVATDLPPASGVVYATSSGSHYAGEPYSAGETVTVTSPTGGTSTYNKTCLGEWQLTVPGLNQVIVNTWSAGYIDFTACDQSPQYNRTSIYGLAANKYDVRITKWGSGRLHSSAIYGDNWSPQIGQDMWVHSVNEISLLDLAYPNMILIGVRALATGQLSGSQLNITAVITHGLRTLDNNVLPGALQAFEEDNPACVAADMMLDKLYGGGQSPGIVASNITRFLDEWVAWAELNDQLVDDGNGGSIRRHVFNGVFDNESNLWDQLSAVGRMSRSQLIPLGRDYGVFLDQADDFTQIFTMGNIIDDSFNETWMAVDDRANQVEISFADSTRFYKQDNPMVYMDPANQDAGVAIKNVRIDGKGITIPAQAWHLARFKERCNQFLLRTGTIKCDVDSIASRPGNVVLLQHDVPEWGWGGRTLPGSTASRVIIDRDDIPFVSGTSYSLIVLFASLQRYTGTVTAAAPVIDVTGANIGTRLTLSSFDNDNRVTRAVIVQGGVNFDCPISSTGAGQIVVLPIPGLVAAPGQTYTLFDTDVLETASVIGISAVDGALILGAPLTQAPTEYSTYFYGVTGSQKLVRIVTVRKTSEFRAAVEWIDYDPNVYIDATPIVGMTAAQNITHPGVTTLTAVEILTLVSGSYIPFAVLKWVNGPDTVGVGIYQVYLDASGKMAGNMQMVARLTNQATTWQIQLPPDVPQTFAVVGFDVNNDYAGFNSAPRVTITGEGVTTNLLLGSTFATGFTYWSITPRAGDALVPDLSNDGEATYTVAGSTLTAPLVLLFQTIPQAKWTIGEYLMLSGFFEDTALSTANVGSLQASIVFLNAAGGTISKVSAGYAMNGTAPLLNRYASASTQIPLLTASVVVVIEVAGGSLSIPTGSVLTFSHLLLEVSTATQASPSLWTDVDIQGAVVDYFTTGSSTGLRVQGSVVPTFSGGLSYDVEAKTITVSWTGMAILWPDSALTYIVDGSLLLLHYSPPGPVTVGNYWAFLYFDIVLGTIVPVPPAASVGGLTPFLSATYDPAADAACNQDGRVALTPGGLEMSVTGTYAPQRPVLPVSPPAI